MGRVDHFEVIHLISIFHKNSMKKQLLQNLSPLKFTANYESYCFEWT